MKNNHFFGTDGIRGQVGTPPITADIVLKLGWAAGQAMLQEQQNPTVIIGKDTRISGYMLESALEAGLSAAGCHVLLLGPMPTSAIAYLTHTLRATLGIVISASHNHFEDNGIKFFSADGYKLSHDTENRIAHFLKEPMHTLTSKELGKAERINDASGRYIEFCKSTLPHQARFHNLKIVIDCANGATYKTAPHVLQELGTDIIAIHNRPNGLNINQNCGSNHPEVVQEAVLKHQANIGIAFDGDGDRVVMVDETGTILDGDDLLYIIAKGLQHTNRFHGGIVGTDMTNLGLENALKKLDIPFERVPVGDQHVIQRLREKEWILGGEPSGHIIYRHVTTTADGIITALQVLQTIHDTKQSLHELKQELVKIPQKTINISYQKNQVSYDDLDIPAITESSLKVLNGEGRVLIRPSGTEPVIRIMVECANQRRMQQLIEDLSITINQKIESVMQK